MKNYNFKKKLKRKEKISVEIFYNWYLILLFILFVDYMMNQGSSSSSFLGFLMAIKLALYGPQLGLAQTLFSGVWCKIQGLGETKKSITW